MGCPCACGWLAGWLGGAGRVAAVTRHRAALRAPGLPATTTIHDHHPPLPTHHAAALPLAGFSGRCRAQSGPASAWVPCTRQAL